MEKHQYCLLFPVANEVDQTALRESIEKNGLREPITVYEGKILDGRNRYNALVELRLLESNDKLKPEHYVEFSGTDALEFVLDKNLARRHLSESQRAMVAAELANIGWGGNRHELGQKREHQDANLHLDQPALDFDPAPPSTPAEPLVSRAAAAKKLHVSTRSAATAAKIKKTSAPEVTEAVKKGTLSLAAAEKVAKLPLEKQREVASASNPKKAAKETLQTTPSPDSPALEPPGHHFNTKVGQGRVWKDKGIVRFEIVEAEKTKNFSIVESEIDAFLDAVTRCREVDPG